MNMKNMIFAVLTLLVCVGLLSGLTIARADSAHFLSGVAVLDGAGNLVATFKEAGLGTTNTSEHIVLSADGSAVYACINGGNNHPKAANKETVSGPISAAGDFAVRNGQTTGSLTLVPIGPGDFLCPAGQSLVLASVSYSNAILFDDTSGTSVLLGDFSVVLVAIT
jgi:hypothetical protein